VLRHGKPIAEISPASSERTDSPSWKRPGLRLTAKGAGLSAAILQERKREDVL
jgi:antitoxin (DNA-binding transcriptional repressor) of toxin-antitoxin stability system